MSSTLTTLAAAAPLAAGWTIHSLWFHRRLARAHLDPLSGLPDRAAFEAFAAKLLRKGPSAVVVIDLDGFKGLNDTFGHAAGDAAIRESGHRLAEWADGCGIVARLGGDEFAAAIRTHSPVDLRRELVNVHQWLCTPVTLESHALQVGASIGAIWDDSRTAACLSRLLRRADEAMYEAKRSGGGWCLATSSEPTSATVNGRRVGRPGTHATAEGGAR